MLWNLQTLLVIFSVLALDLSATDIDRRSLIVFMGEDQPTYLQPLVGKSIVAALMKANEKNVSTTSCRLENKCVVKKDDLNASLIYVENEGYPLEDRETKNLKSGVTSGTFTFYGTSIKFQEANSLPKTSIKLRARVYIVDENGVITRAQGTDTSAFLEIKIKNPFPEYPFSVHKYRIMLDDQEIVKLFTGNPKNQSQFRQLILEVKHNAHKRDSDDKNYRLIETMFDQIEIMAIAEPNFIKPLMGITYHRISKKYDEKYTAKSKKSLRQLFKHKDEKAKTRSYEITIDEGVKAFRPQFADGDMTLGIEKYFAHGDKNPYLIASYPSEFRVVEFKQPDAIGYDGPGRIKKPENMQGAQRVLWEGFVGKLFQRSVEKSTPDRGKFAHFKQFMRIAEDKARASDETMLIAARRHSVLPTYCDD